MHVISIDPDTNPILKTEGKEPKIPPKFDNGFRKRVESYVKKVFFEKSINCCKINHTYTFTFILIQEKYVEYYTVLN